MAELINSKEDAHMVRKTHTSICLRSYHVRDIPSDRRCDVSLFRKTYSVHHTAVSKGFIGLSLKSRDVFSTTSLYLQQNKYKHL